MSDGGRDGRGFCGARVDLGGYGKDLSEIVVGCRQSPPAAGTAIDGGDGCGHTSNETPRRSRNIINAHTWPMCAKLATIGDGEREHTQDSTYSAEHQPTQADTRNRGGGCV